MSTAATCTDHKALWVQRLAARFLLPSAPRATGSIQVVILLLHAEHALGWFPSPGQFPSLNGRDHATVLYLQLIPAENATQTPGD